MENKKILKLFISSTFDDFSLERDALQEEIFPYITQLCSKHGYQFFPIDLRWGVSTEAQVDQKTLDICLHEVNRCMTEPHPDFLILVGNRYGWIPLQNKIKKEEFETIYKQLLNYERYILDQWYYLDENEIPSSYILKAREGLFSNDENWFQIEDFLRNIFQTAILKTELNVDIKNKYFISAVEHELSQYLENSINKRDSIFIVQREIDNLAYNATKYIEKNNRLDLLKEKLNNLSLNKNYIKIDTKLIEENQISNEHLESFIQELKDRLEQSILQSINTQDNEVTNIDTEILFQKQYFEDISKDVIGREIEVKNILNYLSNPNNTEPFFIYGESGIGKTSIIAKTISEYQKLSSNKLIYRFCGISQKSSSIHDLLISILNELGIETNSLIFENNNNVSKLDNTEKQNEIEKFELEILNKLESIQEDVVIFIDSIDQLNSNSNIDWLSNLLPNNLKIVISVLNDKNYEDDSEYFKKIKNRFNNFLEIKAIDEMNINKEILINLLKIENRKIQAFQLDYIDKIYENINSPFYLKIISQEVKYWTDKKDDLNLPNSKDKAVHEFLNNLIKKRHHNKLLVEKFFGYIYASQFNLDESTLYNILSNDEELLESINNKYHKKYENTLPLAVWSRFYHDISFFVKEDENGNINFFHREFNSQMKRYYTIEVSKKLLNILEKLANKTNLEMYIYRIQEIYIEVLSLKFLKFNQLINENINFLIYISFKSEDLLNNLIVFLGKKIIFYEIKNDDKFCLIYHLISKDITSILYNKDSQKYSSSYSNCLNQLSSFYSNINKNEEALKYIKIAVDISKNYTYTGYWDFIFEFNNLLEYSKKLLITNQEQESLKYQYKAYSLIKKCYLSDNDKEKWLERYIRVHFYPNYLFSQQITELEEENKLIFLVEELYKENKNKYIYVYINSLDAYINFNLTNMHNLDVLKINEKLLLIIEEHYIKYPNLFLRPYLRRLNSLLVNYLLINNFEKAILLNSKNSRIQETSYLVNKKRYLIEYCESLILYAELERQTNNLENSISILKKVFNIFKPIYLTRVELYIIILNKLSILYEEKKEFYDAIRIREESIPIFQNLYKSDKIKWIEMFSNALDNLAYDYHIIKNNSKCEEIQKNNINILSDAFKIDRKKWYKRYIKSLNNLKYFYEINNEYDKFHEISKIIDNIKYL